MRINICIFFLIICNIPSNAQIDDGWLSQWPFENGTGMKLISFYPDTVSTYSWKIGKPDKKYFSMAYSVPNAICTELDTTYSKNDTISFTFKHTANDGFASAENNSLSKHVDLAGIYKVDCDTLADYGLIEISFDNGNTWLDLINDNSLDNVLQWLSPKPVLTGRSDWTIFAVNMSGLGQLYNIEEGDTTIRIRFSFISDSIENFREGLMFDELMLEDYATGIEQSELHSPNSMIYPNPGNEILHLKIEENNIEDLEIQIFDMTGKIVYHKQAFKIDDYQINVGHLKRGIYSYIILYPSRGIAKHRFGKLILSR